MNETVRISVPVSPEPAVALGDEQSLRQVGRLLTALVLREPIAESDMAAPARFLDELLQTRADAAASGLTDGEVDAELAVWKGERAARRC